MSTGKSKFAGLLTARQGDPEATAALHAPAEAGAQIAVTPSPAPLQAPAQTAAARGPGRIGRPATGKRSNPDFEQTSLYLRIETHHAVKVALLQARDGRDVSDLVEELLCEWLTKHGAR